MPASSPTSNTPKKAEVNYVDVIKNVNRQQLIELGTALPCLLFVLERTVRYNKLKETISIRHFRDGVFNNSTGQLIQCGVGQSLNTIKRNLAKLTELGYLNIEIDCNRGNKITINLEKLMSTSKLKKPKKEQKTNNSVSNLGMRVSNLGRRGVSNLGRVTEGSDIELTDNKDSDSRQAENAKDNIEEIISTARTTSRSMRLKASHNPRTTKGIQALWVEQMTQHYPGLIETSLLQRDIATFKKATTRMDASEIRDVMHYAAENWSDLRENVLSWIVQKHDSMPPAPHLSTLARYFRYFTDAFNSGIVDADQKGSLEKGSETAKLKQQLAKEQARNAELQKQADTANRTAREASHAKEVILRDMRTAASTPADKFSVVKPRTKRNAIVPVDENEFDTGEI
jgi:hypothetical protein